MKLPSAPMQAAVNADLKSKRSTRLQGPWLALLRLAWTVLSVLALLLFFVSLPVYFASQQKSYAVGYAVFLLALGIFVALVWFIVAVLIFWRKSDDWMALLVSFMLVLQGAGTTIYPFDVIPSFWQVPALVMNLLAFDLLFLVFCLFPSGRFVPRWIPWFGLLLLGWEVLGFLLIVPRSYDLLFNLVAYIFLGGFVVAQLYRYHSVSSRTERQQTKWIVFGVTVTYLIEFVYVLCTGLFPSFFSPGSLPGMIFSPISNVVPILIPLSFGFAILHSRLWDIDIIINRTLVYGALTSTLALIYVSLVIGVQSLAHKLTGQVLDSPLVIVGSTLLIAALFQPLRHRIQNTIDRRFYRRKYDAVRSLEAFSADLRNEVDLNTLTERLRAVVQETMQPTHISLWLRKPEAPNERITRLLPQIDEE
ncbi:MAG: hypothetical protein ACXWPG_05985 [Ktedonobacteraceae bacterium]